MSGDSDSSTGFPQDQNSDDWLKAAAEWWSGALSEAGTDFRARLDQDAKKPPPAAESKPISRAQRRFDADFSRIALPKLLNLITGLAPLVRLDVYSFSEAWTAVWRCGERYGLTHLSDAARDELDSWISRELLTRIDDPLPPGLITPQRLRQITGEG